MCIRLMMLGMWIFAHLSQPTGSIYKPPTIYKAVRLNCVRRFLLTPLELDFSFRGPSDRSCFVNVVPLFRTACTLS